MPKNKSFIKRALIAITLLALVAFGFAATASAQTTDTTMPVISGIQPADGSTIYAESAVISAYYSDEAGGSGIDPTSAMIHIDGRMLMSGCVATESAVSCPKSGLTYGAHHVEIFIIDNAGNEAMATATFNVGDNTAPAVTYTGTDPAMDAEGWIANPAYDIIVLGDVTDAAVSSGIASASVTISGVSYPCSIGVAGSLSCQTSGVTDGHKSLTISVTDNAGNTGTTSGSFHLSNHCTGEKAALSLSKGSIYWASYTDYQARTLSINYTVHNNSTDLSAIHTRLTSSSADNGVTVLTAMPKSIGTVYAGASKSVVVQYGLPAGVGAFRVINTAWAEDACGQYTYP